MIRSDNPLNMKNKLLLTIFCFYAFLISPVYSQNYSIYLDYEYIEKTFVFETWSSLAFDGVGSGARLIQSSLHRQPSVGASYNRPRFELNLRVTPRATSRSGRSEDIDFECGYCRRYGPQIDLNNLTIRDRMERNTIRYHDETYHSNHENLDIYNSGIEASLSYYPFYLLHENQGLFFHIAINNTFFVYKIHDLWNPSGGIGLYIPGLVSVIANNSVHIEEGIGYRGKIRKHFFIETIAGIIEGKDTIKLDYKLRYVHMLYSGYGSGFFWNGALRVKLNSNLRAFLKISQKHYFGNVEKITGFYTTVKGDPLILNIGSYGTTYGTRTNHFQIGMSYDL